MKRTTVSLNQTWEGTAVKILQLSNTLKDIVTRTTVYQETNNCESLITLL
jgi:hypothetical protein